MGWRAALAGSERYLARRVRSWARTDIVDRQNQIRLMLHYRDMAAGRAPGLPSFADVEFSSYSQNGEDGILLLIFAVVGTTSKRVVEMCAGNGIECNAGNLIINHGWAGLLFDRNARSIARGKAFYERRTNAWRLRRLPPTLVSAWITAENVNDLMAAHDVTGEVDLLSLDMDGVDYWVWKALTVIRPRVVVLEYNNRWPADVAVTVPYAANFVSPGAGPDADGYFGASLLAYTKLAREKGYRLVGANSPNTNAFFLREDIGSEEFPAVRPEDCLTSDYAAHQRRTKYPLIRSLPVVNV